ncbi:MAG: MSMEG_0568 family radical SAM protein [Gammaproteobacteria bacterium]|jgi:radical SAM protein (TIGR04043 family)
MSAAKDQSTLTNIQTMGVRWVDTDSLGLARTGGAGPSDHKALSFEQQTVMVPVFSAQASESPYEAQTLPDGKRAAIRKKGDLICVADLPVTPKFYSRTTADGIPYWKIATLHSKDVLATTVLQECVRYRNRATSCQFCAIGESLKAGNTIAHKTPGQLAEVAKAAVELDNVKQMVMTTGTPKTNDRGAAVLCESAAAVTAAVDIPVQAQCEPPKDNFWFQRLYDSGVVSLGMHMEAVTETVRKHIMPGKATVPLSRYMEAYAAAVDVFGRGQVSTYILAGLGDSEQDILAMCRKLVEIGVYPFVVPFVPIANTPLAHHPLPDSRMMHRIFSHLGPLLHKHGMTSENVKAGCAKCGACSSLKSYEKPTYA